MIPHSISLPKPLLIIFITHLFLINTNSLTSIGVDCIYKQGDRMNCRQYCGQYFRQQPQLSWYNITSHQCEPLKICSWVFHYYNYETNQCYIDHTMKQIAPSQYPETLVENRIATFYLDSICVNGEPESGIFQDTSCYCYFMWQNSGTVDMNGYPYLCDQVVPPEKWKGYFLRELIMDKNGTVLMYGQYTPEKLQVIYEQLKIKEAEQTLQFIQKYKDSVLNLIYQQTSQQKLVRQSQLIYVVILLGFLYVLFALSYLRWRSQMVRVSKQQLVQRIKEIVNSSNAV